MFCSNCGQEIDSRESFCSKCGTPVKKSINTKKGISPTANILIILAVVFLITGVVLAVIFFGPSAKKTLEITGNETVAADKTIATEATSTAIETMVAETKVSTTIIPGVLTVGSDTTYPPMEFKEGNKIVGFDVDLTQKIAEKLGLKLDYQTTAWDGIFSALIAHKFDMVISAITITDDKKKEMDFSTPYYQVDQTALVLADSGIDSVAKLGSKTAGVQIGTTGEIEAKKIAGLKVNTYDDNMLAIEE
jgi:ABC-type amino acid transport substrate-binding protein